MEEGLIRVTPDKDKAASIIKMVNATVELISTIDENKFPSNVLKEYYDVIRELASVMLLLDGFKTQGEGSHKRLIEHVGKNYLQFSEHETALMENLRTTRNKIEYDGFFVTYDYLERNKKPIQNIISKLKEIVSEKLKPNEGQHPKF